MRLTTHRVGTSRTKRRMLGGALTLAGFGSMVLSFMIFSLWGALLLIGGAVLLVTGVVLVAMLANPYEVLNHERGC